MQVKAILHKYRRQFQGWRVNFFFGSILSAIVCLINIILTIYSTFAARDGNHNGRKILFEGDCERSKQINIGLHLLINILSTILLSASNFAMQCLSAPTRQEIDNAHAKRKWLDIGVLSFRNLRWIARKRVLFWTILLISSLPLHLLYNSVVYASIRAMDYRVYMATEAVLNDPSSLAFTAYTTDSEDPIERFMFESSQNNSLTRLSTNECIKAYATTFNTGQGSLILVVDSSPNISFSYQYFSDQTVRTPPIITDTEFLCWQVPGDSCTLDPFGWLCGNQRYLACSNGLFRPWDNTTVPTQKCSIASIDPDNWKPFGLKVDYCLSENVEQSCRVEFVPVLAYIVIAFNAIKAAVLLYIALSVKDNPIMTIGDAVASFLTERDNTTRNLCLMSKKNVSWWQPRRKNRRPVPEAQPRLLDTTPKFWSSAVSTSRWYVVIGMYIFATLGLLGLLLAVQLYFHTLPFREMLSLGLGAVNPVTFILWWPLGTVGTSALISNALLANVAQPILSALYYTYNALFTTMMLGVEWNKYAIERKGLRVSRSPEGAQRSTYTLHLPMRWALPLLTISGILHWLLSQSLFVVSIEFDLSRQWPENLEDHLLLQCSFDQGYALITSTGLGNSEEFVTSGYSLSAVLVTFILGCFLLALIVVVGRRKLENSHMPVAGTCSAAISAACHFSDQNSGLITTVSEHQSLDKSWSRSKGGTAEDVNEYVSAAQAPIRWGVVGEEVPLTASCWASGAQIASYGGAMLGHCAFSSEDVQEPKEGVWYAGSREI